MDAGVRDWGWSAEPADDPYAALLKERIVFLGPVVDDAAAQEVVARLMHLEHAAPGRDISLYINSSGGSFSAMSAVYDTMRYVSCEVETVCLGQAVSCAAALLAAGAPGKRAVLPGARVVLRQPRLDEPVEGQADDLAVRAGELLRTRASFEELLARHTGQPQATVAADLERDTVLDAAAAVRYGIADRIVPHRKSPAGGGR
ncbi:ATP-dependent Clp protease proteolytic subunit [Streptomyces sp. NPDC050418]|uniref:ATP-dependent Clp protease proteolytic subunit n=1 Tax=Streptomyces sp. NPDC050418 TaxID=3365612 RepID=UPI0037BE00CC